MIGGSSIEAQVSQAWGKLRDGQVKEAITGFDDALRSVPNNVNAHYGLGLALRTDGQNEKAVASFQKALEISIQMLEAIRSQAGVDEFKNDLKSKEDDRYMILGRMIRQRLQELGVSA